MKITKKMGVRIAPPHSSKVHFTQQAQPRLKGWRFATSSKRNIHLWSLTDRRFATQLDNSSNRYGERDAEPGERKQGTEEGSA